MNANTLNRKRLIFCRERLGITKQEAAKRMQLSQPAYLRYESGERMPSIHVIQTMAEVLGTSVAYLINESDDPTPDCYFIKANTDSELFQLIQTYKNADIKTKERLLTYFSELTKSE